MPHPVPRIDHVVVNVRGELDAAAEAYRRLGFALTARGHHTLGSSNHLAILGSDYLELLGFEPGREGARADLWQHPPGLSGLVFKPEGAGFFQSLSDRGIPIGEAREFSRPVAHHGGAGEARFRTATLADPAIDAGRVFFCEHLTPELVWRDEWRGHANGASAITEVILSSRDPARTIGPLAAVFGTAAVAPRDGGFVLRAAGAEVLVLPPAVASLRLGGAAPAIGEGISRFAGLILRAPGARAHLARAGVPVLEAPGGRVVVPPTHAAGAAIGFVP